EGRVAVGPIGLFVGVVDDDLQLGGVLGDAGCANNISHDGIAIRTGIEIPPRAALITGPRRLEKMFVLLVLLEWVGSVLLDALREEERLFGRCVLAEGGHGQKEKRHYELKNSVKLH